MVDLGAAYSEAKAAVRSAAGGPETAAWAVPVPATPAWTVLDVCRHLTGLAVDAVEGSMPVDVNLLEQFRDHDVVAARDAFADGQVERRQARSTAEVLEEWDEAEPLLVEALRDSAAGEGPIPFGFDVVLVTDLCVHSDDVAIALGQDPPNRDSAAARVALAGYCFGVGYRLRALSLPALRLRLGERERTLGDGEPAATVTAEPWELLRCLAGRRSRAQILDLEWTGDPEPYVTLLPAYGERQDALDER